MLTLPCKPRRAGFTLVEIIVVLVFMGIFAAAAGKLLLRQQRFYNSTSQLIQTRSQIRQAAFMLPADLRGLSRQGGDIAIMTDSSIEIRSVFGSSIVCLVNLTGGWISTVPVRLASGASMTNWRIAPAEERLGGRLRRGCDHQPVGRYLATGAHHGCDASDRAQPHRRLSRQH
jgi:prepilin-type N-terminal cleavage/methylation domain-containing protein